MHTSQLTFFASAAFGLEGLVGSELRRLNMKDVSVIQGGAYFTGSMNDAMLANLRLRFSDRVLLVLGEEEVHSFKDLYRLVSQIAWEELLVRDAKINVSGKCVRSQLMSVSDCQSVSKRAILDRLNRRLHWDRFPETGDAFAIDVAIHSNLARITLNTSGDALNRRGYRTWNGEAPLRETLAASLVELSPWRPGMRLVDPCCGTGTLLIEAAFRQGHRAPGLTRPFACEHFPFYSKEEADQVRSRTASEVQLDRIAGIEGYDINPEAIELANRHIRQAGLENRVSVSVQDLKALQLDGEPGVFLCNPPYGERLGDRKSCARLYRELHQLWKRHPGWSMCAIASDPDFERAFGARADKKRRLYNGRLECEFMTFLAK